MKLLYKVLTTSAVLLSFQAQADVKVHLHRDLAPVVVDGEEVGFSFGAKSPLVLKDGKNQIVVRVSKLVAKQGEHEKFNSEPIVVTFEAANKELTLNPAKVITRSDQVGSFGDNPKVKMLDVAGHSYPIDQGILKRGSGLTRDYERELTKFNQKNGIKIATATAATAATAATTATTAITTSSMSKNTSSTLSDLKADFGKLSSTEKKEFLMWAVGQ
ncbi:YccT family protein [Vibrio penaeicida]|uniref:YccT family protein n=1 Tax=Vibrio penaeicida TaxID=104609 RepID=UPI000CEA3276|nr:DUF2057 family protein [Vibrio penaeicida]